MAKAPLSFLNSVLSGLAGNFGGGPAWRGGPNDIVATLHEDGILVEVSHSARLVIGAAGSLVGRSIFDFVARDHRSDVHNALRAAARGKYADPAALVCEFQLLRVRRAPAWTHLTLKPVSGGRIKALLSTEARLQHEQIAVDQTAVAASERDTVAAQEIADLSHEMKTPLNAIMGFADAMRMEAYGPLGSDKYREYANDIHNSGAHLLQLVQTTLDRAKLAEGVDDFEPTLSPPAEVASECVSMVRGQAKAAGLNMRFIAAPDLPETMIDARIVKQILINLLTNALKFTERGEISLSVEENCGAIDYTVRDTGVGMNNVMLAKLGGRFSDTHQTGVRGNRGSGLGLSLSFELARRHGGLLKFRSTPGEGTTAQFTLPVRRSMNEISPAPRIAETADLDIQSQLDRVAGYRRQHPASAA
ncbi:MAG: HAMP domain-containing histidine kinase [Marinicaulis sp.]|nr:HAMP domain-containing histidine kinase [Marinicaulis sp.]